MHIGLHRFLFSWQYVTYIFIYRQNVCLELNFGRNSSCGSLDEGHWVTQKLTGLICKWRGLITVTSQSGERRKQSCWSSTKGLETPFSEAQLLLTLDRDGRHNAQSRAPRRSFYKELSGCELELCFVGPSKAGRHSENLGDEGWPWSWALLDVMRGGEWEYFVGKTDDRPFFGQYASIYRFKTRYISVY